MSSGTKFDAELSKTTYRPSPETTGPQLASLPGAPWVSAVDSQVLPVKRSRTNPSGHRLVSAGVKLSAMLKKLM